jgi:hypothetical protein
LIDNALGSMIEIPARKHFHFFRRKYFSCKKRGTIYIMGRAPYMVTTWGASFS